MPLFISVLPPQQQPAMARLPSLLPPHSQRSAPVSPQSQLYPLVPPHSQLSALASPQYQPDHPLQEA